MATLGCQNISVTAACNRALLILKMAQDAKSQPSRGTIILLSKLEPATTQALQAGLLQAATAAVLAATGRSVNKDVLCICQGLRSDNKGLQLQVWPLRWHLDLFILTQALQG